MPNVSPPTLNAERLEENAPSQIETCRELRLFLGASNENIQDERQPTQPKLRASKFMGSSTGNMLVDEEEVLEKIFRNAPATMPSLRTHPDHTSKRGGGSVSGDEVPFSEHPKIRSREACLKSSSLAVELARRERARLHVLHITTAEELSLFEPDHDRITAEACVHHLWFEQSGYEALGSLIKCNPAIKTANDRAAIRQAVADGTISILATDHAPHTWEEKQGSYFQAPAGLPLAQHSLLLMLEMAKEGCFPIETVVERACHAPTRIFDVQDRGFLREGYWADLVIVDPQKETVVDESELFSRCNWSPFSGTRFSHYLDLTMVSGQVAYVKGKPSHESVGRRVEFANQRR